MWECSATTNAGLIQNMIRNRIILTEVIRDAFLLVDRKWFVPSNVSQHCYEDRPLPIGYGVTISAPHMHAAMAELMVKCMLEPTLASAGIKYDDFISNSTVAPTEKSRLFGSLKGKRVLDVGSGSGFLTAVMGCVVGASGVVHGIEHVPELVSSSSSAITKNCANFINMPSQQFFITVGDGRHEEGFASVPISSSSSSPLSFLPEYDAIHVGAAAPGRAPQALISRIAPNGCLVIPIDDGLHVIRRSADGKSFTDSIEMGVRFVPLTDLSKQLTQ